jgi:hypothetical protein
MNNSKNTDSNPESNDQIIIPAEQGRYYTVSLCKLNNENYPNNDISIAVEHLQPVVAWDVSNSRTNPSNYTYDLCRNSDYSTYDSVLDRLIHNGFPEYADSMDMIVAIRKLLKSKYCEEKSIIPYMKNGELV